MFITGKTRVTLSPAARNSQNESGTFTFPRRSAI